MKIILDTNFLIYCAKNKLDYVEEIENMINEDYELVVPLSVVNELQKLMNDKWKKVSGKDKAAAALALQLLEHYKIKKIDGKASLDKFNLSKEKGKNVDETIVNLANEDKKNIVCTLDRGMRQNLPRVILVNKFKKLMLSK